MELRSELDELKNEEDQLKIKLQKVKSSKQKIIEKLNLHYLGNNFSKNYLDEIKIINYTKNTINIDLSQDMDNQNNREIKKEKMFNINSFEEEDEEN